MFLTLWRTFKEALKNFIRNIWLNLASVSIMTMALFTIAILLLVTFTANMLLKNIQDKVDISVYFNTSVAESEILNAQHDFSNLGSVKSVQYISRDQALQNFKDENAGQDVIMKSLDVIGDNPLPASLVVQANDPSQYDQIVNYINNSSYIGDISKINYNDNTTKDLINRLTGIVTATRRAGIALGGLFALISILITFNAIRLTIYSQKQEIEVMRLVGASNIFIRLPFIFEGILYAIAATLVSMLLMFVAVKYVTPYISTAIPSTNLVEYYLSNFWKLFGIQFVLGALLGIISSLIAMRKYLKV